MRLEMDWLQIDLDKVIESMFGLFCCFEVCWILCKGFVM